MNDLKGLICPQLFVQFKFLLKQSDKDKKISFCFSENADINDVVKYLKQHNYAYVLQNNVLTVTHYKEGK